MKRAIGDKLWKLRIFADGAIDSDDMTELRYMANIDDKTWEGQMMLWDYGNVEFHDVDTVYNSKKYIEMLLNDNAGYTYADMGDKSLSQRFNDGFHILKSGTLSRIVSKKSSGEGRMGFTKGEYDRLIRWLAGNRGRIREMERYDSWNRRFNEPDFEYENNVATERTARILTFERLNKGWDMLIP